MEKELPIYTDPDYGIEFIVDVDKLEFRERARHDNRYTLEDIIDLGEEGYRFNHLNYSIGKYVSINPPQFVTLAPEQMAEKYNKAVEEILLLTDFELMVNQDALTRRIKNGELPTVDIGGDLFYIDIRIELLRPKDDFSSRGISLDELGEWYVEERNTYEFPYDTTTHQIANLEWHKLVEYPADIVFVEIPFDKKLDPVGWNRQRGRVDTEGLKAVGLCHDFIAKPIPWHRSWIGEMIDDNRIKQPRYTIQEKINQPNSKQRRKL